MRMWAAREGTSRPSQTPARHDRRVEHAAAGLRLYPHAVGRLVDRAHRGVRRQPNAELGRHVRHEADGPSALEVPGPGIVDARLAAFERELREARRRLAGVQQLDVDAASSQELPALVHRRARPEVAEHDQLAALVVDAGREVVLPLAPHGRGALDEVDVCVDVAVPGATNRFRHVGGGCVGVGYRAALEYRDLVPSAPQLDGGGESEYACADDRGPHGGAASSRRAVVMSLRTCMVTRGRPGRGSRRCGTRRERPSDRRWLRRRTWPARGPRGCSRGTP